MRVRLNDLLNTLEKDCNVTEKSMEKITDNMSINSNLTTMEKSKVFDKVYKLWYSD